LKGFYEEINKLAKGRSMIAATDLVVEQANEIVRDAKTMIKGDTYLDRVKEFVPAGDNPVFPDVLWVARTIQQSVERFQTQLKKRDQELANLIRRGRTISAAVELVLQGDEVPSKESVEEMVDGPVDDACFSGDYSTGQYFDFERLDRRDLNKYLSGEEGFTHQRSNNDSAADGTDEPEDDDDAPEEEEA
jgi:hypothetical protein